MMTEQEHFLNEAAGAMTVGEGAFGDRATETTLLSFIPPIGRARDYRLYGRNGRRYTDLWQYGGRALLGHTPPGVLRELKNSAERGLYAPLPNHYQGRLEKALSLLLPGRIFRIYAGEAALRRALDRAGLSGEARAPFPDPALARPLGTDAAGAPALSLWRPFLEGGQSYDTESDPFHAAPDIPLLIPLLPLPWTEAPWILALSSVPGDGAGGGEAGGDRAAMFRIEAPPPSDTLAPVILAPLVRAVYDLIALKAVRGRVFPRLRRERFSGGWERRGIYLAFKGGTDPQSYENEFRRFLDAGFLLPPSPNSPAIIPGILSPGEERKLAALLSFEP